MVKKSIEIHQRHEQWLEDNPDVNLSGLVRKTLDERMNAAGD